jgi:hypothetical protein
VDGLPQQTDEHFIAMPTVNYSGGLKFLVMVDEFTVMVDEKFREGVSAWTAFHSRQVSTLRVGSC